MNPYEILGVSEGAGEKECTSAFRKKVSELHPDKFRSDPEKLRQKEQELKKINEAYQILKNNNFKFNRNYEAGGFQDFNFNTEFNEDIFDIFSHFGFNMGRENTSGSSWKDFFRSGRQQQAFRTQIQLDLLQTLDKITIAFKLNDQQIRTELKAGIRDNEVLNLKINNYLIEVICMVSPVKNFARVGHDLYHLLMVEDEGNRTDININNRSIRIDYDENFKSGERVIIKDGGFPTRNNNRGNLIVFLVRRRDSHLMNILSEWLLLKNNS